MSWFRSNVTGELGNSRSGQESVLLEQGQIHNRSSNEGQSFYGRPDSESCCSGSGVQRHSHVCCYETRIKVAKSHHQRHLPLHRLRRAVGKGGWRMEIPSTPEEQQVPAYLSTHWCATPTPRAGSFLHRVQTCRLPETICRLQCSQPKSSVLLSPQKLLQCLPVGQKPQPGPHPAHPSTPASAL